MAEALRECRECGLTVYTIEGLSLFKKDKSIKIGVDTLCKKCHNKQYNKYWRALNPEKEKPSYLKRCRYCGLEAYTEEVLQMFSKDATSSLGFQNVCRGCKAVLGRDRARSNRDIGRAYHYKTKFNITIEDFNSMLEDQNHSCKICGKHVKEFDKKFAIDHCHTTGIVRGLLCHNCNTGLGHFKDNIDFLTNAIYYLRDGRANQ